MKSIVKQFILFIFFSYLAYFLILNQGLTGGLLIAGMFLLACTFLFYSSVIGAAESSLNFIKFRTRTDAAGMTVISILLFFVVVGAAVMNSFVVYTSGDEQQTSKDKVRFFASTVFQVSSQADLLKTEKNGVIYFYSPENEEEIKKVDQVLQRERESFASFLGTDDKTGLTIEFHEDYESLETGYGGENVAGYYNLGNKSIHFVPTDENWELILVHEYAHYQSHLFSSQHSLPITRIPSWFEEGIADYFADESSGWYDLNSIELIDFHDLDDQQNYDTAATDTYDPYAQSFLAVKSLVDVHGEEIITELLKSRSTDLFYKKLEAKIGMDIEEYQEVFLDQLIVEQNQLEEWMRLAYQQLDQQNYQGLERTAAHIKKAGDPHDIDAAVWLLVDAQLAQGEFQTAAELLVQKLEEGTEEFLVEDLFLLAEIYLLIDPQLSLESALQAEKANPNSEDYFYEKDLVAIYEKINSDEPQEGYRQLLDDEWVYNRYVLDKLNDKLKKEFPEEF